MLFGMLFRMMFLFWLVVDLGRPSLKEADLALVTRCIASTTSTTSASLGKGGDLGYFLGEKCHCLSKFSFSFVWYCNTILYLIRWIGVLLCSAEGVFLYCIVLYY